MKIGIDFGTSFSLPATLHLGQNVVLLPSGKYGIPSVFYYDEWEGVLVGEAAEKVGQGSEAKNLKREIKLELNSRFIADGKEFTGTQIVGHILNNVKEHAIATAGAKLINERLEGVVISVPVAFTHNEKELIRRAALLPSSEGGPQLNVLGFIKEPVAAALAYFNTSLADKTKVLVYDLGGGTCDVAIVEADSTLKDKFKVIDSDMLRIGGKDWDARIETYITRELEKQCGRSLSNDPAYREKIKREAINVKHSFSEKTGITYRDRVRARIEVDGKTYQIPITKALFDELTLELFYKTVRMVKDLLNKNNGSTISRIICVGGSSNMPQVQEGLKNAFFPPKKVQIFEPEKAIAIGAAIYAQYCDGKDFLSDIAAFSYGTDAINNKGEHIVLNTIKKGDRLPARGKNAFDLRHSSRKMFFDIYESEIMAESYPFKEAGKPIMEVVLDFQEEMPRGTPATLFITLTPDGIMEVTADDNNGHTVKTQKKLYL